jgi:hypothetical protein
MLNLIAIPDKSLNSFVFLISRSMFKIVIVFAASIMLVSGCGGSGHKDGSVAAGDRVPEGATEKVAQVPVFNADSAYYFVGKQVSFGPRVPNTQAHVDCGIWLESTLRQYADTLYLQTMRLRAYDGTILNLRNVIGSFQPEKKNRVLLCAHWDSRPWADHDPDPDNHYKPVLGANDGGSGVGVLMELARLLHQSQPNIGVDIIFFDGEDYGKHRLSTVADQDSWALGSQYWSRTPHLTDYNARFGILLDMVGAVNATFRHEGYSLMYAPHIVRKVWGVANRQGFGQFFLNDEGGFILDDHYYINIIRNIPVINIIDQRRYTAHGFFDYWHTVNDTMDHIDPLTLKAVGQTVAAVIWQE